MQLVARHRDTNFIAHQLHALERGVESGAFHTHHRQDGRSRYAQFLLRIRINHRLERLLTLLHLLGSLLLGQHGGERKTDRRLAHGGLRCRLLHLGALHLRRLHDRLRGRLRCQSGGLNRLRSRGRGRSRSGGCLHCRSYARLKRRQLKELLVLYLFFLAESCDFHQTQLNQQTTVRCLSYLSVEFREDRDCSEEELRLANLGLGSVAFHECSGHLDELQRVVLTRHQQVAQVTIQTGHEGLTRETLREHLIEGHQRLGVVAREQQLGHAEVGVVVQHIEGLGYGAIVERRTAERYGLVEHREGIAHTAIGLLGNEVERLLVGLDTLLLGDVLEILYAIFDTDAVEVVDLTTRQDGGNDLVFFGRCEDEDGMLGRLFEGLEEGVEGGSREHVDLVDDEHRVATYLGDDAHLLDQGADILHRVVRCGIELVDVE